MDPLKIIARSSRYAVPLCLYCLQILELTAGLKDFALWARLTPDGRAWHKSAATQVETPVLAVAS